LAVNKKAQAEGLRIGDDITHYQKVVLALRETQQLMTEIDEVIPEWPIG